MRLGSHYSQDLLSRDLQAWMKNYIATYVEAFFARGVFQHLSFLGNFSPKQET